MPLHQYRLIRRAYITDGMREHIPRLLPFMEGAEPETRNIFRRWVQSSYDSLFGHELAHAMEFFERGQIERLKQQNFGWPINKVGNFTTKSANAECKVFAIQWILEKMFTGTINGDDILSYHAIVPFLKCSHLWKNKDEFNEWIRDRDVANRLNDALIEYYPKTKSLLNDTINYMVDECSEFL